MGTARVYSCPACGGQVDEHERTCPYCASPVATVRCANCFHMNVPHALHCSACGRDLGLEPLGHPGDRRCPRCSSVTLEVFSSGPGHLLDCSQCGGQFVEHALLKDLLERRQVYGHAIPRKPAAPPRPDPVQYIPCPECSALMTRRNFGGRSGVIVDVCARHGIWFDLGELPRVMAFVEGGGLARAESGAGRFDPDRAPVPVVLPSVPSSPAVGTDLLDDLADAASALLRLVGAALRR